ncbi:hypothetical protein ABW20_dc0109071 [Dactylellina cionopaga]|nr:hypothetical protein ABW20_dc0109071 [Dactylellina cionopaga]
MSAIESESSDSNVLRQAGKVPMSRNPTIPQRTKEKKKLTIIRYQTGLLEKFHIIRSSINFYNNVIVSCSYSSPHKLSIETFIAALHKVIKAHPILSVGIHLPADKSSPPSFIRLPEISFTKNEFFIIWGQSSTYTSHAEEYKTMIQRLHDLPFANETIETEPLWRVAVKKKSYHVPTGGDSKTNGEGRIDYEIAFCVHHAIADGLSCAAFHYSLVEALNSIGPDEKFLIQDAYKSPEDLEILPPMDDVLDLGLGLKTAARVAGFLGKSILPSFLQKNIWTGGKVGEKLGGTKISVVVVDSYTTDTLLKKLREKKVSMTAFLAYATADALYGTMKEMNKDEYAKMKTVRVSLPMSYRKEAGWGNDVIVDCIGAVDWDIERFKELDGEISAMKKLTHELRAGAANTRDSEIGLLKLVGDLEGFFRGQVGKDRGLTFEVSNLGVLDESKIGNTEKKEDNVADWRIDEALFCQSASVSGPAFSVNVATVRGKMVLTVQWMEDIIKDNVMEKLTKYLDGRINHFSH